MFCGGMTGYIYIYIFFDSISHYRRKAANPYGLRGTLSSSMLGASKIKAMLTGGICGQRLSTGGHFINPAVQPGCQLTHTGNQREWLVYPTVCTILIRGNFRLVTWVSSGGSVYGTKEVWENSSINPHNFQHLNQYFMKPGNLEMSVSRMLHFIQNTGLLSAWT